MAQGNASKNSGGALVRAPRPLSVALDLPEQLTQAQWLRRGRELVRVADGVQWALGDWWNFGERRYGDGVAASARIGYTPETLRRMAKVAGRFDPEQRRADLSWSHHEVVMSLPADKADELLDQARDNEWTREELRSAVRTAQLPAGGQSGSSPNPSPAMGLSGSDQGVRENGAEPPKVIDAASQPAVAEPVTEPRSRQRARPEPSRPEPARPEQDTELRQALTLVGEASDAAFGDLKTADIVRAYRYLSTVLAGRSDAPTNISAATLDSDSQRLIGGVAAWATEAGVNFHEAVDRVLERLTQVSPTRSTAAKKAAATRAAAASTETKPQCATSGKHPPGRVIAGVCMACGTKVTK